MDKHQATGKRTADKGDKDGSVRQLGIPITSPQDLAVEVLNYIRQNTGIFGGVDILNLGRLGSHERTGILAAVLTGLETADHRPAVRAIVIVVAPETDVEAAHARVWDTLLATVRLLAGREMPDDAKEWFKARLKVISVPDRRIRSLLGVIGEQSERSGVIVANAANYRAETTEPFIPAGAKTPLLAEDIWVPQLHALATAAIDVARDRKLYVALETGQLSPTRAALCDLLLSIDGCGVMGSSSDQNLGAILAERVGRWDQWIRDGSLGQVLREIEDLPPTFDAHKLFLRIQMLHKAGFSNPALEAIRNELTNGRNPDASTRVKLARIAQDANASNLASDLLALAVDHLDGMEDLESALATAYDSGCAELEERIASRLAIMFPNNPGILARKRRIMASARDYSGIADMLNLQGGDQADEDFFRELARSLSGAETPNYLGLIASAGGDNVLAEAFRMACIDDALQRHLVLHAFELALPIPVTPQQSKRGERLLVEALEAVFLWTLKGALPISEERIETAVLALVERLAVDPTDQRLRMSLAGLFQPSVSGYSGLAVIASVVLELASRPFTLVKREVSSREGMDWLLRRKAFLTGAFDWLRDQQPVVIGRLTMPPAILTEPADKVVSSVAAYLSNAPIADKDDISALQTWLAMGASVAPHGTDPDLDILLMRVVGTKFASTGYVQVARDLAEQTLLNCAAASRRRRLGWFAMADIYHRCHNYIEGLLAFACALAADDVVDEEQAWYEAIALSRFFRDLGLHSLARTAIGLSREHLVRMGLSDTNGLRLDTIELQIRQLEFERHGASNAELEGLIDDVVRNGAAIIEHVDETAPAAAVLGQLLTRGRQRGITVPPKAEGILAQLCERAGGNISAFANMLSTDSISADDLLSLVKVRISARYSDDVGYDMRDVAFMVRRALAADDYIQNPVETSFALELIADYGLAIPGWDEAAKPPDAPKRVEQPAEIAAALSLQGLSVVQIGFDSNGRLVRLATVGGHLQTPVREPDDIICEERFRSWTEAYPHRYGIEESSPNLFYTTTADLRLSELPNAPVVISADVVLQSFPPNIFFLNDDFSGRTHPMAAIPSLAWLSAAQQKGHLGDGRLCSWISTAGGGSGSDTLSMVAERLAPTLTEYGFMIDNGPTIPAALAGSTMAVITAHGGIDDEEGFFRVVSDEGALRVTPDALAAALRNVGIVVLFVCSGGRSDKHPGAHTTLGLARQILDRGSQAVVASPWPLDSRVPAHWLPTFLAQWSAGERLIEANFTANKIVDQNFALDPARGLAMTVFGNPMVRRV